MQFLVLWRKALQMPLGGISDMRKILEYIHRPNQTEIGIGSTHDAYLLLPPKLAGSEMFVEGEEEAFLHIASNTKVVLKAIKYMTGSKDFRLTKFGDVRNQLNIECGDELVFRRELGSTPSVPTLETHHFPKVMLYPFSHYSKDEYVVVHSHRIPNWNATGETILKVRYKGTFQQIRFVYIGEKKKRADSPKTTAAYKIFIGSTLLSEGEDYCISFKTKDPECYVYNKSEYNELSLI